MEFISQLPVIGQLVTIILPFLIVLTVVVFFHELGHFLVARYYGVKVTDFSIGFGPEITGFYDKYGTRWRFAWIPLGGYVKFVDDDNAASMPDQDAIETMSDEDRQGSFHAKPLAHRAAVVAAGPIANFILAVVIFAGIFMTFGERITEARVSEVIAGGAAEKAGFRVDDVILEIDGGKVDSFFDVKRIVSTSAEKQLGFLVARDGGTARLTAVPGRQEVKDKFGNELSIGVLGIRSEAGKNSYTERTYNPVTALWKGVEETYFIVDRTFNFLGGVFAGRESAKQVGGPIRIAVVSSQAASDGLLTLVNLIAVLSVSIGLINLFPIPMLDGGHLLFYFFEAIKGEPLNENVREYGARIGLALVLMLMVFALVNDLSYIKLL